MEGTQIMIRGAQGNINLHQLTCYLTQTVLLLRDRDNQAQTVILCGTGSAIPTCVLIAEIVARKLPNLSQITEFVSIESKVQEDPNNQRNYGPATGIRVKLTFQPTEEDKKAAGYQIDKVEEDKAKTWANLYEFVMMYASDLAAAKLEQAKTRRRGNDDKRRGGNTNQRGGERRERQGGDRQGGGDRSEQQDRPERQERQERQERSERQERQERPERPDNRGDSQVRGRGGNRDRREFRGDRQDSHQQDGNNRREGYPGQQRRPVKPQFEQNDRQSNNQRSEFVRRGDPKARGSERTRGSERHEQQSEQQQVGGDRGQIRTRGGNVRQTPGQDQ